MKRQSFATIDAELATLEAQLAAPFEIARAAGPQPALRHLLRGLPRRNIRRWVGGIGALLGCAASISLAVLFWPAPKALGMDAIIQRTTQAKYIKTVSRDGIVQWESPGAFYAIASKKPDGSAHLSYWDISKSEQAIYDQDCEQIVFSTREHPVPSNGMLGAAQVLCTLVESHRRAQKFGGPAWQTRETEYAGRPALELTGSNSDREKISIVADLTTGRILDRNGQQFEYPDSGPTDIYALGAPRSANVVDVRANAQVLALRDQVRAAWSAGFSSYHFVESDDGYRITEVYSDGTRLRLNYFVLVTPELCEPEAIKAVALSVLQGELIERKNEFTTMVDDGEFSVSIGATEDGHAIKSISSNVNSWINSLAARVWPGKRGIELIGDSTLFEYLPPDEHGWIGLRMKSQAYSQMRPHLNEYWFDPKHHWARCASRYLDDSKADWQLDPDWSKRFRETWRIAVDGPREASESKVLEWAELRPGQWYPAVRYSRSLRENEAGQFELYTPPNCENCRAEKYTVIVAEPLNHVDESLFAAPGTQAP